MKSDLNSAIEIAHQAGLDAQIFYNKMSFDTLIDDGPEYFASVAIAQALSQNFPGGNVGLEVPFELLRDRGRGEHGKRKRGAKAKAVSHNGKVDIALWQDDPDGEPRPRFLFEVKLKMAQTNLQKDIERLANLVDELSHRNNGTVIGGALIILTQEYGEYSYENRRKKLDINIELLYGDIKYNSVDIKLMDTKKFKIEPPLYSDYNPEEHVTFFVSDCVTVIPKSVT